MKKLLGILFIIVIAQGAFIAKEIHIFEFFSNQETIQTGTVTQTTNLNPSISCEYLYDGNNTVMQVVTVSNNEAIGLCPLPDYCKENSGTVEITNMGSGGQVGFCHLSNGETCQDWAYMRGGCDSGQPVTDDKYPIQGSASYPSEGIPNFVMVCAKNINTKAETCTYVENSPKYKLYVSKGDYYVYQRIDVTKAPEYVRTMTPAYYSDWSECIKNDLSQKTCIQYDKERKPLTVTVSESGTMVNGKFIPNINPRSW